MTEFDKTPNDDLTDALQNLGDAPESPNQDSIKVSFLSQARFLKTARPTSVSSNGAIRPVDRSIYSQTDDLTQEGVTEPMRYLRYRGILVASVAAVFTLVMCSVILVASTPTSKQINEAQSIDLDILQPITTENINDLSLLTTLGDGDVQDVAWSPDGLTIAIAGSGGIHLHNADDLNAPARLLTTPDSVSSIDYSPDSTLLAGIRDDDIWVWDATTGEVIQVISVARPGNSDYFVHNVMYSPDGNQLSVTVCTESVEDRTIYDPLCTAYEQHIYATATGELVQTLDVGNVRFVAFNPDWSLLAYTISNINGVYLLDVESGEEVGFVLPSTPSGSNPILLFDFTPDGDDLIVTNRARVSTYERFTVADILESYDPTEVTTTISDEPQSFVSPRLSNLFIDPDTEWFIKINDSGDIIIANFLERNATETISRQGSWYMNNIAINPDGSRILAVQPSLLTLWDIDTQAELDRYQGYDTRFHQFVFNQQDTALYATSWNNLASEWNLTANPIERTLWGDDPVTDIANNAGILQMHPTENIIAYSIPSGNSSGQRIFVRDLETGEEEFVAWATLRNFDFVQDGTLVGLNSGTNNIWQWNPDTELQSNALYTTDMRLGSDNSSLSFSPDGRLIATFVCAPSDLPNCQRKVVIFDANGEASELGHLPLATLDQEILSPHYNSLHFSPDSNYLLLRWCTQPVEEIGSLGCTNYDVSIWDVRDLALPEMIVEDYQPNFDDLERLPAEMTLGLGCDFLSLISILPIGTEDMVVVLLPCIDKTQLVAINPTTQTMEVLYEFGSYVESVGINHSRTLLALGTLGGKVELWGMPE